VTNCPKPGRKDSRCAPEAAAPQPATDGGATETPCCAPAEPAEPDGPRPAAETAGVHARKARPRVNGAPKAPAARSETAAEFSVSVAARCGFAAGSG